MRSLRVLVALSSFASIAIGGLVACGDDTNNGTVTTNGAPDASHGDGATPPATPSSVPPGGDAPVARAKVTAIYLGQTATLDGSQSTGSGTLGYAWAFTSVPSGSAITAASLTNATSATPTFTPDKLGTYEVTLTVTGFESATSTATAKLEVVDAPVFFLQNTDDADAAVPFTAALRVTHATVNDGGSGTAVLCFGTDAGSLGFNANYGSGLWADWWEAPAGAQSRSVLVFDTTDSDGGVHTSMLAATAADTCATAPRTLATIDGSQLLPGAGLFGFPLDTSAYELPRFSPNGNRIAYVRTIDGRSRIASIGFDGATPHNAIAPVNAVADGAPDPDGGRFSGTGAGPRPVWLDDGTIAWLQITSAGWQIVTAPDQDTASPQLFMSCTGTAPEQFDVLPSGAVIVAQQFPDAGDPNKTVENVVVYSVTSGTKACGTARNISKLESLTGIANVSNFALSPDKARVAYISNEQVDDSGTALHFIRVARTDGTGTPESVGAPMDTLNGSTQIGPRWIAGGSALAWPADATKLDAGGATGTVIEVATPDGGLARSVAGSTASSTTTYGVGTASCSFGAGVGSSLGGLGVLGLLALRFTRRRARRAN